MVVVNGWTIYVHPLLLDQLEKLTAAVEAARAKDPEGWTGTANAKVLVAVRFSTASDGYDTSAPLAGITLGASTCLNAWDRPVR